MPRSIKRWLVALGVDCALIALGLALWIVLSARIDAASNPAPASVNATTERYCSNWDFRNNTGQDVNGLRARLKSVKAVSSAYTGPLNPFGAPDGSSGYEAGTDVYRLNFSGGTAFDSDLVQVGFCTDAPLLRLDQQSGLPLFDWTLNSNPVSPKPLFTGLEWSWSSRSNLRIHIVNEQNVTMTLMAVNLLDAGNALTLDDLSGDVTGNLPLALELLSDPLSVAPHADSFFDIVFSVSASPGTVPLLEPNHPYVVEALLAAADDDGNSAHLYAQGLSPLIPLYLPIISK